MHRVFFDSNAGSFEFGYLLWFDTSKEDLNKIGSELRDGLEVIIYMPEELELTATLRFDTELDCWRAVPLH